MVRGPIFPELRREQQRDAPDPDRLEELEGRSDALKWILVACFGYQGFSNAKFERIECHEAINAVARDILLTTKESLETGGWQVVHGIVDSIWVTPDPDVPDEDRATLDALADAITEAVGIRLRESDIEEYDPEFEDPLYPWTQAFGVIGGLVLLTQMGTVPMVGAVFIVSAGLFWYYGYVDRRVEREGIARDELRRRIGKRAIDRTKQTFASDDDGDEVLVAVTEDTDPDREYTLVQIGAVIADTREGRLTIVRFDEVPDQLPLESAREVQSREDVDFEERMGNVEDKLGVPVEYGEIVSHNASHAIVNFARHDEADLLVTAGGPVDVGGRLRGRDVDRIASHAPCDLLLVDTDRFGSETVALVTDQGPFDPLKVQVADAIAAATDAEVELVHALQADLTEGQADTVDGYHNDLAELFSVPVSSTMLDDDDPETVATAVDADLVIVGNDDSAVVRHLDDRQPNEIVEEVESGAVVVRPNEARQPNLLNRLVERLAF